MEQLQKIEVNKLEDRRKQGVEDLDYFREGRTIEFDTVIVAATMMLMIQKINQLIDVVTKHDAFMQEIKERPSYRKGMKPTKTA